jgi:hypothetical protein
MIIIAPLRELFSQAIREGDTSLVFIDPELNSSNCVVVSVLMPGASWARRYYTIEDPSDRKRYQEFMKSSGPVMELQKDASFTTDDMFSAMEQAFHWGCRSENKTIATVKLYEYIEGRRRNTMSDCSKGWVCARCGKSHAPWVHSCDCPVGPVDGSTVASKSEEAREDFHNSQDLGEKVSE